MGSAGRSNSPGSAGLDKLIFQLRGVLPVPVLLVVLVGAEPTSGSLIAGGLIALAGEAIRLWAAGHIKAHRVYEVQAERLVTTGPYAYVRNPLYGGNFLIGLGFSAAANWWPAYVLFALVYVSVYAAIVPLEERYLRERFGEEYEAYASKVRRIWPRLAPYRGAPGRFDVSAAVRGEVVTMALELLVFLLLAAKRFA